MSTHGDYGNYNPNIISSGTNANIGADEQVANKRQSAPLSSTGQSTSQLGSTVISGKSPSAATNIQIQRRDVHDKLYGNKVDAQQSPAMSETALQQKIRTIHTALELMGKYFEANTALGKDNKMHVGLWDRLMNPELRTISNCFNKLVNIETKLNDDKSPPTKKELQTMLQKSQEEVEFIKKHTKGDLGGTLQNLLEPHYEMQAKILRGQLNSGLQGEMAFTKSEKKAFDAIKTIAEKLAAVTGNQELKNLQLDILNQEAKLVTTKLSAIINRDKDLSKTSKIDTENHNEILKNVFSLADSIKSKGGSNPELDRWINDASKKILDDSQKHFTQSFEGIKSKLDTLDVTPTTMTAAEVKIAREAVFKEIAAIENKLAEDKCELDTLFSSSKIDSGKAFYKDMLNELNKQSSAYPKLVNEKLQSWEAKGPPTKQLATPTPQSTETDAPVSSKRKKTRNTLLDPTQDTAFLAKANSKNMSEIGPSKWIQDFAILQEIKQRHPDQEIEILRVMDKYLKGLETIQLPDLKTVVIEVTPAPNPKETSIETKETRIKTLENREEWTKKMDEAQFHHDILKKVEEMIGKNNQAYDSAIYDNLKQMKLLQARIFNAYHTTLNRNELPPSQ